MNRYLIIFTVTCTLALLAASTASAQGELEVRARDGRDANMPMVEEALRVEIDRQYAQSVLRQEYQNESGFQIEGRYRLQVGEGTTVQGFAYWNGEEKIVGEVFERNAARQVYESVTNIGRDPGLLEQTGEGEFSFRVFPIESAERKRIEIELGQWLRQRNHRIEYRAPLTRGDEVTIHIRDERPIANVTSPSHDLTISRSAPGDVTVRATPKRGQPPELVVRYEVEEPDWNISARVHRDRGHDPYLVLSMDVPRSASNHVVTAKDVTLVLDRSGSMSGEPLRQARRAATDLVGRLRDIDRINVILFDDGVETLYPTPRQMSDTVRAEVLGYIDRVRDGGGTNIAMALERALAAQNTDQRPHVVLFLTDGQSDSAAALRVAEGNRSDARIYTIGVGHGVQRPLLSRLASTNRGRFTFIESAGAITERMATLYEQLAAPVLVGLSLEVEGVRALGVYPQSLADLYRDDELRISSRLMGTGTARVALSGTLDGRPVTYRTTVTVPEEVSAPWVGRLWAQSRVDDLLEEVALRGATEERTNEVIELALAYNFVTPYTSFLAIPESELTEGARQVIGNARERRRQIMQAHQDAAALSRNQMPPGDPVLRVSAPADALSVTAYFPFGLVKDLSYDAERESWRCRFLVPHDVVDGEYDVRIVILGANGEVELATVPYTIDSDGPEFEAEATVGEDEVEIAGNAEGELSTATMQGVHVRVETAEEARRVTVALVEDATVRMELSSEDGIHFEGFLPLSAGNHQLRVVVADRARNESDDLLTVDVSS